MPFWLEIALPAFLLLLVLLAVGGVVANRRRAQSGEEGFVAQLESVDRALAAARAEDKGWEPSVVLAAARSLFERQQPGVEIRSIDLVQVLDRPGTDQDEAVFTIMTDDREIHLTLGRQNGEWVLDGLD